MEILVALVFLATQIALFLIVREHIQERDRMAQRWYEERQILLNRIENPKYKPPITPAEKRANMEQIQQLKEENEAFGLVGRIVK